MPNSALTKITPRGGYQLELTFENGSYALINLKNRIGSVRFRQISNPLIFETAKINDDKVCWHWKGGEFSVYVTELLDSMLA